ncbi:hypothetical protein [Flammeovirga agarivorans]|uniref:Uncharacterized protein n=1 Tax=Flammeovirga agarivorans TaxID=2726742 RepID=A0A7X8SH32_9BACT|nr:hypothetical protein [Flammeovirga agarivorans]NLR90059.1 hypothetical protein [Flammeovirga agarivorans]
MIGFYFIDETRKAANETDIWHVVASESIALVELENPQQVKSLIDSSEMIIALKDLEGGVSTLKTLDQLLLMLDSAKVNPILGTKQKVYFSLNSTGSQPISWSVYIPTDERVYLDPFTQLTSLPQSTSTRQYKGMIVHEYYVNGELLTVAKIRNFIVASTDALWVEEAIRNNGEKFYDEYYFKTLSQKLSQYDQQIELAEGINVWLRPNSIAHWFSRKNTPSLLHPFPSIEEFSYGMRIKSASENSNEVQIIAHNVLPENAFNGFVKEALTSSIDKIHPLMVDDIAFYQRWHVSNINTFIDGAADYSDLVKKGYLESVQKRLQKSGFDLNKLSDQIKGDIAKATITNVSGSAWQHLYFMQLKNNVEFDIALGDLRNDFDDKSSQKVELIGRSGFTIYRFPVGDVSGGLMGVEFQDSYQASYLLRFNDFMVICGDLPTLSQWLNDWLVKRRWVKQQRYNVLINKLKNTEGEASFVMNTETSWPALNYPLSKTYRDYLNRHLQLFLSLNFQLWNINKDQIELCGLFSGQLREDKAKKIEKVLTITTGEKLAMAPSIFKDVMGQPKGFTLIDKENIIETYSFAGDTLFYQEFDSTISSEPQLMWDMNGEASVFISLKNKILHLSRNTSYTTGFPVELPIYSQIQYLKWLPWHAKGSSDMIQNTDGLVLATDTLGNIYGIDKKGEYRGKWLPQNTLEPLIIPPYLFQSDAKNYVVTLSKTGKLIIFDAEGRYMKGFPMLFKNIVSPQIFVVENANLDETVITFITLIGDLVEVNGKGDLIRKEELGDRSSGRTFDLLIDEARKRSYMILDQRHGLVKVKDSSGQLLFENQFEEKGKAIGQFFDFGIDAEVVGITFPLSQKTYLYYTNGKKFVEQPIRNNTTFNMFYDADIQKFVLVSSFDNKSEVYHLNRRN